MQTYIAHYRSPAASDARATGLFEFQSDARAGTKANSRDARLRMLEPARDAIKASVLSKKRPGLPETEGNAGRKTLLPQ